MGRVQKGLSVEIPKTLQSTSWYSVYVFRTEHSSLLQVLVKASGTNNSNSLLPLPPNWGLSLKAENGSAAVWAEAT
jgi:hypothetical protein